MSLCGLRLYVVGAPGSRGQVDVTHASSGWQRGPGGEGEQSGGGWNAGWRGRGWQRAEAGERGDLGYLGRQMSRGEAAESARLWEGRKRVRQRGFFAG